MNDKTQGITLTVSEAAERTGLPAELIRQLIQSLIIPANKKSGRWLIGENDLLPILELVNEKPDIVVACRQKDKIRRLIDQIFGGVIASGLVTVAYHYLTKTSKNMPLRVVFQYFYALADRDISAYDEILHPEYRFVSETDPEITFIRSEDLEITRNMFAGTTAITIKSFHVSEVKDIGHYRGRPCLKIITKARVNIQTKEYGGFTPDEPMIFFLAKHEGMWKILEIRTSERKIFGRKISRRIMLFGTRK